MSHQEQQRRRELKRERRALDRIAHQVAAAGKGNRVCHNLPSTRAKQARWHHEVANAAHRRQDDYRAMVARMRAIAAELARDPDLDPPCECHMDGDTFDPAGCPAHDKEMQTWA